MMIAFANGLTSVWAQSLRIVTLSMELTERLHGRQLACDTGVNIQKPGFNKTTFTAASPTSICSCSSMHAYSLLYKLLGNFRNSFPNGQSHS